jgi:hypothetical protein
LPLKIQVNSKKLGFERKNQFENVLRLWSTAQATLVNMKSWTISNPKNILMSLLGSIIMVDESKSNHLVLLNPLEFKIIVSCAVHIYNSKTQFHTIESLYLNQT